jgi:uncharacterized protein YegL
MSGKLGDNINVVKRTITVFFLLDKSGSMDGARIASLNDAIPNTVTALKDVKADNPNLRIVIKVIEFSSQAALTNGANGQDVDSFIWRELTADGYTVTASAINLLCDNLDLEKMPKRGYPPVCVLVSDGYCTESDQLYNAAIDRLNKDPWGRKAARIVISIGDDLDETALRKFVNRHGEYINCTDATQIGDYIRIKTTEATLSQSESVTPKEDNSTNGSADVEENVDLNEVW